MNYKLQAHFLNDISTWRAHISALITMDIIKSPFLHQCRLYSNVYGFKIVQKSFIQSSSNLQEANHLGFSCQQLPHFVCKLWHLQTLLSYIILLFHFSHPAPIFPGLSSFPLIFIKVFCQLLFFY